MMRTMLLDAVDASHDGGLRLVFLLLLLLSSLSERLLSFQCELYYYYYYI